MKATGIVRRVDALGRIIIPKEIRGNMQIKDGDSFEIFTDNKTIAFKKYRPDLYSMSDIAQCLTDVREFYDGNKKEELIEHLQTAYLILNQNS